MDKNEKPMLSMVIFSFQVESSSVQFNLAQFRGFDYDDDDDELKLEETIVTHRDQIASSSSFSSPCY